MTTTKIPYNLEPYNRVEKVVNARTWEQVSQQLWLDMIPVLQDVSNITTYQTRIHIIQHLKRFKNK